VRKPLKRGKMGAARGGLRMDVALIVYFSFKLSRMCRGAGVSALAHIIKFAGSFILCEFLGMLIFIELGLEPFTLFTSIGALLIGGGAGYLSYRKSMSDIRAAQSQNNFPRLPG
jgi:hypothetical protein